MQETREQRTEVKGEGGWGGRVGHVGPGVQRERKGLQRGAQWRREEGPTGEAGRQGSWSEAFTSMLKLRN